MALQLYLEGLSLRGIERLLKISHVTVLKWVRQWGKAIARLRREAEPKEVRQVEIDELCSYIGEKKKQKWVWVGVDRERGKVLDFVVGDRSERTGRRLYERLKGYQVKRFCTDYWGSYKAILSSYLHKASKAETHGLERVNSLIRHYLARFRRQSWCFSGSLEMMVYSLEILFFLKINGGPWEAIVS
jgi:insertion element IS1 protein InsB